MCLVGEFVSDMTLSNDMLKITINEHTTLEFEIAEKINNLIPQMWGRLYNLEHYFQHESIDILMYKIRGCIDILISNLIGVYLHINDFFVVDINPIYYEDKGKVTYVAWINNDEKFTAVEFENLSYREIQEKVRERFE